LRVIVTRAAFINDRCNAAVLQLRGTSYHRKMALVKEARSGAEALERMTRKVKGMVLVAGVTYRIVRVGTGAYSAVRIQDDEEVGSFTTSPALSVDARLVSADLLRDIARFAIHSARTSSVCIPAPAAEPESVTPRPPSLTRRVPVAT
jgi:hypothetical protein